MISGQYVAVDSECRRLPGGSDYYLLSIAVVDKGGAKLHIPVRPMGLELDEIRQFHNPPHPPEALIQALPPSAARNVVKETLRGFTVLVWNEEHEARQLGFLYERDELGRKLFPVQDVMRRAAPYVKHWNPHFADYEYPSLHLTATTLGLEFTEPGWHDARADAQMILDLWHYMEDNPPFAVGTNTQPVVGRLPAPDNLEHPF